MAWLPYVDQGMNEDGLLKGLREMACIFLKNRVVKSDRRVENLEGGALRGLAWALLSYSLADLYGRVTGENE